ncbi:MAG: hypothetical protein ACK5O7_03630 [Holosporales bacterium]
MTYPSNERKFAEATLLLIGRDGWSGFTLTALAGRLGVTLDEVLLWAQSPEQALARCGAYIDELSTQSLPESEKGQSVQDRLFEVLMARFDALHPYRDAVKRLAQDLWCSPGLFAQLFCVGHTASGLSLEAAGLTPTGPYGLVQQQALGLVLLYATVVWLEDETEDQAKTMAALDRALKFGAPILQ